jgi:hypothetical protein
MGMTEGEDQARKGRGPKETREQEERAPSDPESTAQSSREIGPREDEAMAGSRPQENPPDGEEEEEKEGARILELDRPGGTRGDEVG